MQHERIPCTAIIPTLNSEKVLRRCLVSIADFAEIILVDGNSTDATHAIAKEFGARIIKQKETDEPNIRIDNFTEVRQKGLAAATHHWVVNIDSDEWFSEGLIDEIREVVKKNDPFVALQAKDLIVLDDGDGVVVQHAWSYPHISMLRLYNTLGDTYLRAGKKVHERWIIGEKTKELVAKNIVYFSYRPYAEFREKTSYYLGLALQEYRGHTITVSQYFKYIIYRNVRASAVICVRVILTYLRYGVKNVLPIKFVAQSLRYQLMLIVLGTRVFYEQHFL